MAAWKRAGMGWGLRWTKNCCAVREEEEEEEQEKKVRMLVTDDDLEEHHVEEGGEAGNGSEGAGYHEDNWEDQGLGV